MTIPPIPRILCRVGEFEGDLLAREDVGGMVQMAVDHPLRYRVAELTLRSPLIR